MSTNRFIGHRRERRGVVLAVVALLMLVIFGAAALVIDFGRASAMHRVLQASSDAAATAGAQMLPDPTAAKAAARAYSSIPGSKNARADLPGVTMAVDYPKLKKVCSTGLPCGGSDPDNTIIVKQEVSVPTIFARVLGFSSFPVSATSTATMAGGIPRPMDVIVIVDVSASMADNCSASGTGVSNAKRIDCAKAGVRTFLTEMWPCHEDRGQCGTVTNGNVADPLDRVGLMVFPGVRSSAIAKELDCNGTNISGSDVVDYDASPIYEIVPLSSDYKTSSAGPLAGSSSKIVKAVAYGLGTGCQANGYGASNGYGLEAEGGAGSQFHGVIAAAQAVLAASGRPDVQKAIILLSDGDASGVSDACQRAINNADAATAAGTWVFAIAYGASSSSSSTCDDDSPSISARNTMIGVASDAGKFFDQPNAADLSAIFKKIANQLTTTRMVRDSAQ